MLPLARTPALIGLPMETAINVNIFHGFFKKNSFLDLCQGIPLTPGVYSDPS